MITFALLGCGDACLRYGYAFQDTPHAKLASAMDIHLPAAKSFGDEFHVPFTDKLGDILNNREIQAVIVVLPHHLHAPMTIQCAQAGKHVLCEKPMATSVADARKMQAACKKAGVKLGLSFAMRYRADYLAAKKIIADGAIGKSFDITLKFFGVKTADYWTQGYRKRVVTHWRKNVKEAGGGQLLMNLIHNLDIVRFVTGLEVTRVAAEFGTFSTPVPVDVEDTLNAVLRFNNAAVGAITTSSAAYGSGENSVCILGTKGQMVLKGSDVLVYPTEAVAGLKPKEWNKLDCQVSDNAYAPYRPMVEAFATAIENNTEPPIGAREGIESLKIALGIYDAGRRQQVVTL